jgi:hypothetical protein
MSKKMTAKVMRAVGAGLAVCSAAALMGSAKASGSQIKKSVHKTADKVLGFVDSVASMM